MAVFNKCHSFQKFSSQDESLILEDMRRKVYDNFKIDLSKIQLLYARKGNCFTNFYTLRTATIC